MKQNKHKEPMRETTKDDSSDVQKVRQDKQAPPENQGTPSHTSGEDEEAEKGHS